MIQKGVEWGLLLQLLGDIALSFLSPAVPLAVFVAAFYALRRLSQDLEIVAMHSSGFSRRQLSMPFFFLSVLIATTLFSLQWDIVPQAKSRFKNTVIKLSNVGLLTDIKGGMFFTEISDFILFAHKVGKENKAMEKIFINRIDGNLEQFIFAEKGFLKKESHDRLAPPSLRFHLINGNMLKIYQDDKKMEKVVFKEYDFPLTRKTILPDSITKDSMRSYSNLLEEIAKKKREIRERPESRNLKSSLNKSLLEYWLRIQTPLQCLIFMLWGIRFSLRLRNNERRQRGQKSGWVFLALVGYHALLLFGIALAKREVVPPFLAVLLPNGLVVMEVLWTQWRKGKWV